MNKKVITSSLLLIGLITLLIVGWLVFFKNNQDDVVNQQSRTSGNSSFRVAGNYAISSTVLYKHSNDTDKVDVITNVLNKGSEPRSVVISFEGYYNGHKVLAASTSAEGLIPGTTTSVSLNGVQLTSTVNDITKVKVYTKIVADFKSATK